MAAVMTDSCISGDSLVLTQTGPRPIMELQRGDKTIEGSTIARIIEQPVLLPNITLAVFDTPNGPVKTCLHHVFIHEGKRKLAQNMPGVRIVSGKTEDLLPNSTFYDIQFDFEGSYTVGSNLIPNPDHHIVYLLFYRKRIINPSEWITL